MESRVVAGLLRFGSHGTRLIGAVAGERIPLYYVCEYPKSGGTWLGQMLAEYLGVDFPQKNRVPIVHPAVVHNHWPYTPGLRRVFYLYRDGRDVMTSLYFHRMRALQAAAGRHPDQAFWERYLGRGFDPDASRRNMARFIEGEVARPRSSRLTWPEHVRQWAFGRPHVVTLTYEQLLADAVSTLERVLPAHTGEPFDRERAAAIVDKFSFKRQTGRRAGTEDRKSFLRKGVAGDWVNHFDRAAGERFDRLAGDLLVELGYADDRRWYHYLPG